MKSVFNSTSVHEAKIEPFLSVGLTAFSGKRMYKVPTCECVAMEPMVVLAGSDTSSNPSAKSTTFVEIASADDFSFNTETK